MKTFFTTLFFIATFTTLFAQFPDPFRDAYAITDSASCLEKVAQKGYKKGHRGGGRLSDKSSCNMSWNRILGLEDAELNLTEQQQKDITAHYLVFQKEVALLMAQMRVKRSELNLMEASDKPETKKIYKLIDELGGLMGNMMRHQSDFKLKVRSVLTPEQRIIFDYKQNCHKKLHKRACLS